MRKVLAIWLGGAGLLAVAGCAEGGDKGSGGSGGDAPGSACVDNDRDGKFAIRPNCVNALAIDCDDNNAAIPGAVEIPGNGKDDDCKGGDKAADSDCTRAVDKDGDQYYDQALQGTPRQPRNCKGVDCLDTDRNVYPGGPAGRGEIPNNGKDDDCNAATPDAVANCVDADGDGYGTTGKNECPGRQPNDPVDCDEADAERSPGADEVCDGKDNNCDAEGKVDECAAANTACGTERKVCLGNLNAACAQNRDCDVEGGYKCEGGKCKLFGDNAPRCLDDADCATNTCDLGSGKCRQLCEVVQCGSHNVCGEAQERTCDNARGCMDCQGSDLGGGCDCGLCAGYKCFDGPYFASVLPAADADGKSALLQVIDKLVECFGHAGSRNVSLCTSFDTTTMEGAAIDQAGIDAFVCGDHEGLEGDQLDKAKDLVGCGLFNLDELEMERPVGSGEFYSTCVWWDGADVKVDECLDFPANLEG